jgi:hypothetical protein
VDIKEATNDELLTTIKARFIAARDKVELVGAHVRVAACSQNKRLMGLSGVLIGETENTWKIVVLERPKRNRKQTKSEEDKGHPPEDAQHDDTETVVVPKRGSSLVLILPISSSTKDDPEVTSESDEEKKHLIVKSERSLCITLDPSSNEIVMKYVGKQSISCTESRFPILVPLLDRAG